MPDELKEMKSDIVRRPGSTWLVQADKESAIPHEPSG
jgi:hypothetical protein